MSEYNLQKKINNLFKDTENEFDKEYFSNSKFNLEEFSPEERKEIEAALRGLEAKRPPKPKKRFRWTFNGRFLFKLLLLLMELCILFLIFWLAIPFSINININLFQAAVLSVVVFYLRFWWK